LTWYLIGVMFSLCPLGPKLGFLSWTFVVGIGFLILFLVRDNIGENIGTSLLEECRSRNVKSVFICPRHPQQNYSEGYLGRVTAMASFAMVFAGAPLFMWVFAIRTAVFVGNISASYYSKQGIWSTPYELIHGEPFPDASIVVPFGCAVLVLRDSNNRSKFQNRCTLMVFVHYSDDHPLFTYAVYYPGPRGCFIAKTLSF
jgi:hypothetical protein